MTNWKLRGKCVGCRKKRWFIRIRSMKVPSVGQLARSKDLMCTPCYRKLKANLYQP